MPILLIILIGAPMFLILGGGEYYVMHVIY